MKNEKEDKAKEDGNEKVRLKEETEKERLNEKRKKMEEEALEKEKKEEREREEERRAIVARAKKEAKEERKSWTGEKSFLGTSSFGEQPSCSVDPEEDVIEDQHLQKEIEDAIQNEDIGAVDVKTSGPPDSSVPSPASRIPTAFRSGLELGLTSKKVDSFEKRKGSQDSNEAQDNDGSEHIYEDIDDLRARTSHMKIKQLEEASKDDNCSDDSSSKPKSGKKSRAPLPPGVSSSLSSSLSSSPGGVSSFAGSSTNLVQQEERIRHLTPVRLLEEEEKKAENNKEEDEGQVFYRSPGYPAPPRSRSVTKITISGSAPPDAAMEVEEERLVRRRREEVPTSPSPTRIFTSSGGITRLRTYSPPPPVDESSSSLPPSSPGLLPRSEAVPRCPHCTIHAWLPHSPGCPNKFK